MKDQGFDISDYYKVRDELGGNESFFEFVELAHQKGIKILFDVAINHTSIEHPWFQDAKNQKLKIQRLLHLEPNRPKILPSTPTFQRHG